MESRSREFQRSEVAEWILLLPVCEGSPSNPKMNLQLLELSNKRATGNIVIRKYLISVLRN
jgi:hypothetical protein